MKRIYRILRRAYAERPFDGEGSFQFGGRWSHPGTRVPYAAAHFSLAMIEYFVHVEETASPKDLVVVAADVPADVSRESISVAELPAGWKMMPALPELANIGDRFVSEGKVAVLIVPSVIVPVECNWMLNPGHPDFARITIQAAESFTYDTRFFRP